MDRAGDSVLSSRLGLSTSALEVTDDLDFWDEIVGIASSGQRVDYLICDEAQFYTRGQVEQLARLVDEMSVDVYAFGITADFRTCLFPGSQRMIELADRVQVLQVEALCWCGSRATHNARVVGGAMVVEGEQVVVGDTAPAGPDDRGVRGAVPPPLHAPDDVARRPRGVAVTGGAAVRPRPVPGAGAAPGGRDRLTSGRTAAVARGVPTQRGSVELGLPVRRHEAPRARCGLVHRVVRRRGQRRPLVRLLAAVAPEPVLAGLEALDELVPGLGVVQRRVLGGRGVTAPDVPARRATTQVEPPAGVLGALETPGPARRHGRVDPVDLRHPRRLSQCPARGDTPDAPVRPRTGGVTDVRYDETSAGRRRYVLTCAPG